MVCICAISIYVNDFNATFDQYGGSMHLRMLRWVKVAIMISFHKRMVSPQVIRRSHDIRQLRSRCLLSSNPTNKLSTPILTGWSAVPMWWCWWPTSATIDPQLGCPIVFSLRGHALPRFGGISLVAYLGSFWRGSWRVNYDVCFAKYIFFQLYDFFFISRAFWALSGGLKNAGFSSHGLLGFGVGLGEWGQHPWSVEGGGVTPADSYGGAHL